MADSVSRRMKGDVIAEDGSGVKYSELRSSSLFQQYKAEAAALKQLDLSTLSEKEKMAFFISILFCNFQEPKYDIQVRM